MAAHPSSSPRANITDRSLLHAWWLSGRADQDRGIRNPPSHPDLARAYVQGRHDARCGLDRHSIHWPATYFAVDIREDGHLSGAVTAAVISCNEFEIDKIKGPNAVGYVGCATLAEALERVTLMNAGDHRAYGPLGVDQPEHMAATA